MATESKSTIPITIALLLIVAVVLLTTLVVPVMVGVGKILLVVCAVLLIGASTGLLSLAVRRR